MQIIFLLVILFPSKIDLFWHCIINSILDANWAEKLIKFIPKFEKFEFMFRTPFRRKLRKNRGKYFSTTYTWKNDLNTLGRSG
jgi:hypothetical protein